MKGLSGPNQRSSRRPWRRCHLPRLCGCVAAARKASRAVKTFYKSRYLYVCLKTCKSGMERDGAANRKALAPSESNTLPTAVARGGCWLWGGEKMCPSFCGLVVDNSPHELLQISDVFNGSFAPADCRRSGPSPPLVLHPRSCCLLLFGEPAGLKLRCGSRQRLAFPAPSAESFHGRQFSGRLPLFIACPQQLRQQPLSFQAAAALPASTSAFRQPASFPFVVDTPKYH